VIGYRDINNRKKEEEPSTTHVGWAKPEQLIPGLLARVEELEEENEYLVGLNEFIMAQLFKSRYVDAIKVKVPADIRPEDIAEDPSILFRLMDEQGLSLSSSSEGETIESLHEKLLKSAS